MTSSFRTLLSFSRDVENFLSSKLVGRYAGDSPTLDSDFDGRAAAAAWYRHAIAALDGMRGATELRWTLWEADSPSLGRLKASIGSVQRVREQIEASRAELTGLTAAGIDNLRLQAWSATGRSTESTGTVIEQQT